MLPYVTKVTNLYLKLIRIVIVTTFVHFVYPGPPLASWAYMFHLVLNMVKSLGEFRLGTSLKKLRKRNDRNYNPIPEGFCLETRMIPDWCREKAHRLIKARMMKDMGYAVAPVRDTHWSSSPPLVMELVLPNNQKKVGIQKTIFFVHGGAYMFCSVNSYRPMVCNMAKKVGTQISSIEYRLSPENPFPCALEDTLASYLYMTSPKQPGLEGLHIPSNLVAVCGDSAGGGLITSLLAIIEKDLTISVPCGGLLMSPWIDLTASYPSYFSNGLGDYIPGPELAENLGVEIKTKHNYHFATKLLGESCPELKDELEERGHFYAPESFLKYPLVSPVFNSHFSRFPPMMIVAGNAERLRDEAIVLAWKLHNAKSSQLSVPPPVILQIFDDMPHIFQNFSFHPAAFQSMEWCCNFLKRCLTSDATRVDETYPISDRDINPKDPWAWRIAADLQSHPLYEHDFNYLVDTMNGK